MVIEYDYDDINLKKVQFTDDKKNIYFKKINNFINNNDLSKIKQINHNLNILEENIEKKNQYINELETIVFDLRDKFKNNLGFCKSVKLEKSNEKIKKEIDIIDQVKIIVDEDLNAIYEGITSQYVLNF